MGRSGTIILAASAALASGLAQAADLEIVKAEPTIYVPNNFLWGGVYVGGFVGGGWATADWGAGSIVVNTPSGSSVTVAKLPVSHVNVPISGFLGGGRVGANYQVGAWVFGFEGDFTGMVLKGHTSTTFGPVTDKASGVTYTGTSAHRTTDDWATTFTGRVGYTFDRVLAYGKLGVAVEQDGDTVVSIATTTTLPATTTTVSGAGTATRYGWTAGAGFEYAFDKHWSGFVEYDHLGFLSQLVNLNPTAVPHLPSTLPSGITVDTARLVGLNIDRVVAGANYRF
jgi:outer membrane immunogenic protein